MPIHLRKLNFKNENRTYKLEIGRLGRSETERGGEKEREGAWEGARQREVGETHDLLTRSRVLLKLSYPERERERDIQQRGERETHTHTCTVNCVIFCKIKQQKLVLLRIFHLNPIILLLLFPMQIFCSFIKVTYFA